MLTTIVPSLLKEEVINQYIELAYLAIKFNKLELTKENMILFFKLLCKVHGNLFSICDEEYEYFGIGLYYPNVGVIMSLELL